MIRVKYLDQFMQKSRLWGKYIVLLNGFYLGLCHLQSHLCLSTFAVFSPSTRDLAVTIGQLGLCATLSDSWATEALPGICADPYNF